MINLDVNEVERDDIINKSKILKEQVVTNYDNNYDYKKENNNFYYKEKSSNDWILSKGKASQSIQQNVFKEKTNTSSSTKLKVDSSLSKQVVSQIKYLNENNLLKNMKFTILDDRNSQVYSFNPNYTLYKKYNVITGRNRGDVLTRENIIDFVKKNKNVIINSLKNMSIVKAFTYIKNTYLDRILENKNTPSGVFKRSGFLVNLFGDAFLTSFFSETYGDVYITWESLDGKIIPFGFHGTKKTARLKGLDAKSSVNRKLSYGCVNFRDEDIKEINKFITPNQISIWLPDSGGIVELPKEYFKTANLDNPLRSYYEV